MRGFSVSGFSGLGGLAQAPILTRGTVRYNAAAAACSRASEWEPALQAQGFCGFQTGSGFNLGFAGA